MKHSITQLYSHETDLISFISDPIKDCHPCWRRNIYRYTLSFFCMGYYYDEKIDQTKMHATQDIRKNTEKGK